MRIKLLSLILLGSFVFGSLPAASFAQADQDVEPPVVTLPTDTSTTTPEIAPVVDATTTPATTTPEITPAEAASITQATTTTGTTTPQPASISIVIRYGEHVAWNATTTLPDAGTVTVSPTDGSAHIGISTDSLLAVLLGIDNASDTFAISDLNYYSSFNSFIVNCITAPSWSTACGQWQYVVNGNYPFVGIDQYELHDGDQVFLYFGNPRQVALATTRVSTNVPFVATAQSYDPATDTYSPLPGYTIGITQPNPNDPWNPLEIATSASGADGTSSFTLGTTGTYSIGLKEDFYYPATSFTVMDATTTPGGGSGGGGPSSPTFSAANAFNFLRSGQHANGTWDSELVTDWSAIALASPDAPADMRSSLTGYFRSSAPQFHSVRDYERHAIALMALGVNPYTGGPSDYITPIVKSFDGTQIADPGLVNDDIFALIPLLHAGYTTSDDIIAKTTAFVISKQHDNGSWEESADLTAAGIQALSEASGLPGVRGAIARGESYLHSVQKADAGFGNLSASDPFATSWVAQAIASRGGSPATWTTGASTPLTYLVGDQATDGGMNTTPGDYSTRAWATAYAIPAVSGITWESVMQNFPKPGGAGALGNTVGSSTATSTTTITPVVTPAAVPIAATTPVVIAPTLTNPSPVVPHLGASISTTHAPAAVLGASTDTTVPKDTAVLPAAVGASGAWEWLTHFFSSLWSFLTHLFS